jgi:hypothetical protein
MNRFDDVVRTERYFSATLLPAILLHRIDEDQEGLKAFLHLATKAVQEAGKSKVDWTPPSALREDEIEVITEFHIARDLKHAQRPLAEPELSKKDAPDLVIVVAGHLIVCEAKFFTSCSPRTLNPQLQSQKTQIRHLFENRPELEESWWHIAILPVQHAGDYDCDGVVTWDDVTALSCDVLGADHYVTRRFANAMEKYRRDFGDPSAAGEKNYEGITDLDGALSRGRGQGDRVQLGHVGGAADLRLRGKRYIEQKPWKYRNPATTKGKVAPGNWIDGSAFVRLVEELMGGATGQP